MANLDPTMLNQIVAAVIQVLQVQGNTPKATASAKPSNSLEAKDRALVAGFKRRGITDVVLMDRNDLKRPFNVKHFKQWLAEGRMVMKGQHGIRGLFHISQNQRTAKASPRQRATPIRLRVSQRRRHCR